MKFAHSFVNREDAQRIIIRAAESNCTAFYRNMLSIGTNKQLHTFLVAEGGSGVGKTRTASEVVRVLRSFDIQTHTRGICRLLKW
jgi:Cdc6-like AAA superfamily ATPase